MTKSFLIQQLENLGPALRSNRLRLTNLVLENTELIPFLVEITFEVNSKTSIKAAWILELCCEQNVDLLIPYLDFFTQNIGTVKFDSAVRPVSKICNFIAKAYNSKNNNSIKQTLSTSHIDEIIEAGFDWMISNHKVAAKAYTMNALYIFGKKHDWVHEELKLILEQNIPKESAAYKARGKITLSLINKK